MNFCQLVIANCQLLSNHLIRSRQHVGRNRQTDLLGRLQIDDELELLSLLRSKSAGLAPLRILSTQVAARRSKSFWFTP
jgi:hypothetical protein